MRTRLAAAALAGLLLAGGLPLSPKAAVYIVRHAEKKSKKDPKSKLSRKGEKRAEDLRRVLASVELKAVYCTDIERTQQTAAPTAKAHGLKPTILSADDVEGLVKALKALPETEDVLVVGHSDTIPDVLEKLGAVPAVKIGDDDFDNLWVVDLRQGKSAAVHRLHY